MTICQRNNDVFRKTQPYLQRKTLDCVDKALSSVLGREAKNTFYFAVEDKYNLPQDDFAKKPLELLEHLTTILGTPAFAVIENSVISEIKTSFNIPTKQELDLHDAIEESRKRFLSGY